MRLRTTKFNWKGYENEAKTIGLIAEEVAGVIPEAVVTGKRSNGEEVLGLNYAEVTAVLIKAVQDLSEQNKKLEQRLQAVEHRP